MLDLLCIGEAMAEIRSEALAGPEAGTLGFAVGFAGDSFNTAVYARRAMGQPGAVGYMTRVGNDPLSGGFLALAQREGLDTRSIVRDPSRAIGIYTVATDDAGERSFHYWRDQSAARMLFSAETALPTARILYLSGITLAILSSPARERLIEALIQAKSAGALVAFDSNFRPKLWEDNATARAVTAQMWALADLAFPSIDDEMALFGETREAVTVARFAEGGFTRCAIKRGERGPLDPMTSALLPDFPAAASVIDTTAAGDSFNAGYLAAFLQGSDAQACLSAGHALAATVVGVRGAIAPV